MITCLHNLPLLPTNNSKQKVNIEIPDAIKICVTYVVLRLDYCELTITITKTSFSKVL